MPASFERKPRQKGSRRAHFDVRGRQENFTSRNEHLVSNSRANTGEKSRLLQLMYLLDLRKSKSSFVFFFSDQSLQIIAI